MEITQLNPSNPRPAINARAGAPSLAETAPPSDRLGDQVELSDRALLLSRLRELPDVRQDLVDQVRSAIERGEYETPEKLDAAIEKLLTEQA